MIQKTVIVGILLIAFSCKNDSASFLGTWKVRNIAYNAEYQILQNDIGYSCFVLQMNDGTSEYKHNGDTLWLFKHVLSNNNQLGSVDGSTGATQTETHSEYALTVVSKDTLELSYKIAGQVSKELWTKKNKYE